MDGSIKCAIVFGGSGFIGTHLIELLYNEGCNEIYNLDLQNNNHNGKSKFVLTDVRKKIDLFDFSNKSEAVIFNLAATHRTPGHPDYDYFETNILGAENVTEFARVVGVNRIVFTSSIAPYGASEEEKFETTLPTPNTPYGISKLTAEKIHLIWQAQDSSCRKLIILRPGVVFGKGENGNFTRLFWAIKKRRFFYPGRRDTIKACIYVKDLCHIALEAIMQNSSGDFNILNCTYFPAPSITQIVGAISKEINVKEPKLLLNARILKLIATTAYYFGGGFLGIHPDRVKKLMISTNINGGKLFSTQNAMKYGLAEGIKDWNSDNNGMGLF